jgi:SsrA-binding protein
MTGSGEKLICRNKKASHDYFLEDRFEAGLVLQGTEVKSLRNGKASLVDAYVMLKNGELWLLNCHIAEYTHGNRENHNPVRSRKCLMHRREIDRITGKVNERGFSLIPVRLYFKKGRVKLEFALAKGKKRHDKRESMKQRDAKREADAAIKRSR